MDKSILGPFPLVLLSAAAVGNTFLSLIEYTAVNRGVGVHVNIKIIHCQHIFSSPPLEMVIISDEYHHKILQNQDAKNTID